MSQRLLLCTLLICQLLIPLTGFADAAKDSLTLGVFPRRNAQSTVTMFAPLAAYLSKQLGREVRVQTAKDFESFWHNLVNHRYDIVHFNQYDYLQSRHKIGFDVIAKNEEYGSMTLSAGILVRKDSHINSLQDLRGKTIVFGGGKRAMIAYIVNTAMLRRAGLKEGDYVEKFSKNPPNATFAAYNKEADAAGIGNVGLKIPIIVNSGVHTEELKFVALSEPLPHLPWAVSTTIDPRLKAQIQVALLQLNKTPQGQAVLAKAKLTALHAATDAEYDIFVQIINEVFPADSVAH